MSREGPPHIPFNRPPVFGTEHAAVAEAIRRRTLGGGAGEFSRAVEDRLKGLLGAERCFLTPTCTASLEMAAILAGVGVGDEVIAPSFTFVSTAGAFALRGARIVFVDIRPDTMNIDQSLIEQAITPRTRAIVAMHYNGVACEMDAIMEIARGHDLMVIEDAAQALGASYRGRPLGGVGHLGAVSFDSQKNVTCGEGGLIAVNDPALVRRAEVARDKGANRAEFLRGGAEKYHWVGPGGGFVMNEISAAFLSAQLDRLDDVLARRRRMHARYEAAFAPLAADGLVELQQAPAHLRHSAHLFYVKLADDAERARMIDHLRARGVSAVFHYVPLHSSPAGRRFGRFSGEDRHTSRDAARLLRLPLHYDLTDREQDRVIAGVAAFFGR